MNKSQLKQLIREVILESTRKKQFAPNTEEFDTEVEISDGESIPVRIVYEASYEDRSFDYSYGSINGTHDPGSGMEIDDFKIVALKDFGALVKRGMEIPIKLLSKESVEDIEKSIQADIKSRLDASREP